MPKILYKEDEKPEFKGEPINIKEWLAATAEVKNDAGEVTGTEPANVSEAVFNELKNATEVTLGEVDPETTGDKSRVVALRTANLVAQVLTAQTKVKADKDDKEGKPYATEYVNLSARTVEGALIIMAGIADTEQYAPEDTKKENELPSVTRYFNTGYGILARNAAAARIRTLVEGPDKALEAAARDLARAKGWSFDKALAKIKLMAADD